MFKLCNRQLWDSSWFYPKTEDSLTVMVTIFGWLIAINHDGANLVDCSRIYRGNKFGLSVVYRLSYQNSKQTGQPAKWRRFWFINWQVSE